MRSLLKSFFRKALYTGACGRVFTSGLILTVCGFVDGIISKQNAISMVGILLGKGTIEAYHDERKVAERSSAEIVVLVNLKHDSGKN